jgi:hypothetical protein
MQSDIDQFYSEVVSPFVRDFEVDRASVKCAYGAVWALDSYASHLFYFFRDSKGLQYHDDADYKKKSLVPNSSDYKLILDVSNATKHAVKTRGKPTYSVFESSDVSSMDVESYAAYFAGVEYEDWGEQVVINNEKHLFEPLLPTVILAEGFLLREKDTLAN